MPDYSLSTAEICRDLLGHCTSCYRATVADASRLTQLDDLVGSVSDLERFVHGYEIVTDPSLDITGEILSRTFPEAVSDLCAAVWLLASGFYKASAASLRSAFEIAIASLYFQIRENTDPAPGGCNQFFSDWGQGRRPTPNWGEMKPFISSQPAVRRFKVVAAIDVIGKAHSHFKYLCAYTHSSAFANNGDPVSAVNTTGPAPVLDKQLFARGCTLSAQTIALIAILWQVAYPQIAATLPLGPLGQDSYKRLFPPPLGPLALRYR